MFSQTLVLKTLIFIKCCAILLNIGNEDKQMWFATFIRNISYENGGGTYDSVGFYSNNKFDSVRLNC